MTPDPDGLAPDDPIGAAINRMTGAGSRTVPLMDAARRPIGIVTVHAVVCWLAERFPEAIQNRPPRGCLRRPLDLDAG